MSKYGLPLKIGRFLRKDWVKKEPELAVKYRAFMPDHRDEVSCFEIQNLSRTEVFDIAIQNGITPNGKPPVGYAVINEDKFPKNLMLDHNDMPPRHVDIIGWDRYPSKEDKMEFAGQLAELASDTIELQN